jgi:hypothetical protein
VTAAYGLRPRRGLPVILDDIHRWLRDHRDRLEPILKN